MIARHFGVVTALVVGTFAVSLCSLPDDTVAPPRPGGIHRMRAALAIAVVFAFSGAVGVSTVGAADALISFMTHMPGALAAVLVVLILPTATGSLAAAFGSGRRAAIWGGSVFLVLTAAAMWLLGLSAALLGYSIGFLVTAFAISMVLPFYFKGAVALQPSEAALARRRRRLSFLSYAATALAAIGAAILVGAPARGPIMDVVVGIVVAVALGFWVGGTIAAMLRSMLMPLTLFVAGDATPWRRPFWRFAADRSILTRANMEFRFIHLLVRDHLAACDEDALANSVRQRSAQLLDAG